MAKKPIEKKLEDVARKFLDAAISLTKHEDDGDRVSRAIALADCAERLARTAHNIGISGSVNVP